MRVVFLLFIAFVLHGCAYPSPRPDVLATSDTPGNGIVFGSFAVVDGLSRRTQARYRVSLRRAGDDTLTRFEIVTNGFPRTPPDAVDDGVLRYLFAMVLPAGQYELVDVEAYHPGFVELEFDMGTEKRQWHGKMEGPVSFAVQEEAAVYLGSHALVPQYVGTGLLPGGRMVRYVHANNRVTDEALARELYAGLPSVTEPEWIPDTRLQPTELLRLAYALNPEGRYWKPQSWRRVRALMNEEQ
ncbi:MAG: hypothetical protein R3270_03665 [Gammaproteobacteria bacterium]|nr:hypothetical protein [Gammaproteobacteria bacterium]